MIETTEQIQNPVTPEPALAEVPEPSLPEIQAQPPAPELSQPDGASPDEVALISQIAQLWQIHIDYKTSIKHQTQSLRDLRAELGKLLHQMKATLAKPGRNGQWSSWLKEKRIPRATADRLVLRHERSLDPDSNCLNEQITQPSDEEIKTLLNKVLPKLQKGLPTSASAFRFVELLASSLALDHQATGEGLLIMKPVQKTAVVEPAREAQVERTELPAAPVPVTVETPAGGSVESAGASIAL